MLGTDIICKIQRDILISIFQPPPMTSLIDVLRKFKVGFGKSQVHFIDEIDEPSFPVFHVWSFEIVLGWKQLMICSHSKRCR